jgi:hypothetical protein
MSTVKRLIREQGLPAKYLTPRIAFFDEGEVDTWLSRRNLDVAKANANHTQVLRAQRKRRKEDPAAAPGFRAEIVPVQEAKA